jgi:hypothetical protein
MRHPFANPVALVIACVLMCVVTPACSPRRAAGSVLHVADPKAAGQLLEGWHQVEGGSWRWTRKRFAVAINNLATVEPATLRLRFSLPPSQLERLGSMTLVATVNGVRLPGKTYTSAGDQVYSAPVPASALQGPATRIVFDLDKAAAPTALDARELGIIVFSVALE